MHRINPHSHYHKNQYPYFNYAIHGNGNSSSPGIYQNQHGSFHYNQNNRPPIDPIEYDTGTVLGAHSRSRVKDKSLGRAIGWGGFGLDLFSGFLGGIAKVIQLKNAYKKKPHQTTAYIQPNVDPRIASVSYGGSFSSSKSGSQSPTMTNATLSQFNNMLSGMKTSLEGLKKQNEDLVKQNKEMKEKIASLEKDKKTV